MKSVNGGAGMIEAEYITQPQLAEELGRSTRTLDRWAIHGMGPARTRIGSRKLYRRVAVLDWLRSRESPSAKPARRRQRAGR